MKANDFRFATWNVLQLEGCRRVGRPKGRWIDGVNGDTKRLGIRNWWTVSMDRQGWRKILEEARSQPRDVEPRKKKTLTALTSNNNHNQ